MSDLKEKHKNILEELANFENQLDEIPSKFGIANGMGRNFDYPRGKLRFDSWLTRFTNWISNNLPGSEKDIAALRHQYHNDNCRPAGSGYGTKSQMVNTVFIKPFINRIDSLREDIISGHFEAIYTNQNREKPVNTLYVSVERINEIEKISDALDYNKLVMLLKELNSAYENKLYFSVGFLIRAIIDHVPPVFGCKSFAEIANNYQGTKSFKEAMKGLNDQIRKVTDSYLHTQIREKEVLPVEQQIEARSSIDLLLSEIIRVA